MAASISGVVSSVLVSSSQMACSVLLGAFFQSCSLSVLSRPGPSCEFYVLKIFFFLDRVKTHEQLLGSVSTTGVQAECHVVSLILLCFLTE